LLKKEGVHKTVIFHPSMKKLPDRRSSLISAMGVPEVAKLPVQSFVMTGPGFGSEDTHNLGVSAGRQNHP
jgi:hypothetical protein